MSAANPPDATAEGPDRWCYDALEPRSWESGSSRLSLLRSLELVWIHFDGNPACFANLVDGEQAIEDFLVGAPAGPTPPAVLDEVRAYLRGARTPGRSTWLALELAPGHLPVHGVWWRIDGVDPAHCDVPGPDSAGLYGGASARGRRGMRALVRPGAVEVYVGVSPQPGTGLPRVVELTRTIDVPPHVGQRVQIVLDPSAPRLVITPA